MFFQTLVAETLVLAKTHGYVEKIEDELEQELARDIRPPPAERLNRFVLFKAHCLAYPSSSVQMHAFVLILNGIKKITIFRPNV